MSDNVKVYSPNDISMVLANNLLDSGYGDGEFCKLEQQEDDFSEKVGTDGEITMTPSNSKLVKITLTFMQSSDQNAKMSAMRAVGIATRQPLGPLLINDRAGTSLYGASKFWIKKPPDATFDKEATTRQWVIMALMDERFDGGN